MLDQLPNKKGKWTRGPRYGAVPDQHARIRPADPTPAGPATGVYTLSTLDDVQINVADQDDAKDYPTLDNVWPSDNLAILSIGLSAEYLKNLAHLVEQVSPTGGTTPIQLTIYGVDRPVRLEAVSVDMLLMPMRLDGVSRDGMRSREREQYSEHLLEVAQAWRTGHAAVETAAQTGVDFSTPTL